MQSEQKDRAILEAIGTIYCRAHHAECAQDAAGLCPECREVVETTLAKAQTCPYGHSGNCQDCDTQCQRGTSKQRVKAMMRYAAPRMVYRHPLMTLSYVSKKFKKRA